MSAIYAINQRQWADIIKAHYENPGELIPLCLGANGIGKSQIAYQVAHELGIQILDVRLLTMFPTDLRGMPWVDREKNEVKWGRPTYLPKDGKGILFIDEITNCGPEMQAAAYEIIQNRRCGEHRLGDGWQIVAAGNRVQDMTGARALIRGLATRTVQLELEPDPQIWLMWAMRAGVDKRVIGYIHSFPDVLLRDNPNEAAHCRPRTWAYVGQTIMKHFPRAVWEPMIAGTIGAGQAANFMSWIEGLRLPGPIDILFKHAEMPIGAADQYIVASSVAQYIIGLHSRGDEDKLKLTLSAFLDVSRNWQPDKGYMVVQALRETDKSIIQTLITLKEFSKWATVYREALL